MYFWEKKKKRTKIQKKTKAATHRKTPNPIKNQKKQELVNLREIIHLMPIVKTPNTVQIGIENWRAASHPSTVMCLSSSHHLNSVKNDLVKWQRDCECTSKWDPWCLSLPKYVVV